MLHCKQQGFVLFIVLLFMQIFVLLNGAALENVLLLLKFSKNSMLHDELLQQSKIALHRAESTFLNDSDCTVPLMGSNERKVKPLAWWKANACSGNFQKFRYYYVVESLAVDSCANIEHEPQTAAAYFRMTLLFRRNLHHARQIFLQSTLVKPTLKKTLPACAGVSHSVQIGRQSWRALEN